MRDNSTAEQIYYLHPDGKCPVCKTQIRVIDPEYKIYKTRLLKILKSNRQIIKCPDCKNMIIIA